MSYSTSIENYLYDYVRRIELVLYILDIIFTLHYTTLPTCSNSMILGLEKSFSFLQGMQDHE